MMSTFFHFQHTLNRLFNNSFLLKYEEGQGVELTLPRKNYPQKAHPY